jgi:hypothetical protein
VELKQDESGVHEEGRHEGRSVHLAAQIMAVASGVQRAVSIAVSDMNGHSKMGHERSQ